MKKVAICTIIATFFVAIISFIHSSQASALPQLSSFTATITPLPTGSYQVARATFLPDYGESNFSGFNVGSDYNQKGDCNNKDTLYTTKTCSYPRAVLSSSSCTFLPGYYKECKCLPQFKLTSCSSPYLLGGDSCDGKYEKCVCPKTVNLNNTNDKCTKYCDGNCIEKTCTPSSNQTNCTNGTQKCDNGCGENTRNCCVPCKDKITTKPANSSYTYTSCTDGSGSHQIQTGWKCNSGYHETSGSCQKDCTVNSCSGYSLRTCPANASCTSCTQQTATCSGGDTYYALSSCGEGYHVSGSSCIAHSYSCPSGYQSSPCTSSQVQTGTKPKTCSCGATTGTCYTCRSKTCTEQGLKDCNGSCIAKTECCGGCPSGKKCENGTCVDACTANTCSGYSLSSCPTHGNCSTCKITNSDCSTGSTKYKLDSCEGGYVLSGNSCIVKTLAIGDILYSDMTYSDKLESGKTPIGVFFDTTNKLAVALDTQQKSWSTSSFDIPSLSNKSTAPTTDMSGKNSTLIITSYCSAAGKSCPAAEYAHSYSTSGTSAGDWYLPAGGELDKIYKNLSKVNNAISLVGGTQIYEGLHWSSSEQTDQNAWIYVLANGNMPAATKTSNAYVRPVFEYCGSNCSKTCSNIITSKPSNSSYIYSSCTDSSGTHQIQTGWKCNPGYFEKDGACEKDCTPNDCTGYPLLSCPTNATCNTCVKQTATCTGGTTYYSFSACKEGYHKSGSSCVAHSYTCPSGYQASACSSSQVQTGTKPKICSCGSTTGICYACRAKTCAEQGLKDCNGTCIPTTECCGGCPSGQKCENGTCVSACTPNACSGYSLSSCPTHGKCSTCSVVNPDCSSGGTKYKLDSCESGYTMSGNTCVSAGPAVGDILYSDLTTGKASDHASSGKTAIGVVVNPNKTLAIALKESTTKWATTYFDIPNLTNIGSVQEAASDWNGKSNTQTIIEYCSSMGNSCPAAEYANSYTTEGTSAGDWYLPAGAEAQSIFSSIYDIPIINETLTKVGGTNFSGMYWVSQENGRSGGWTFDATYGSLTPYMKIQSYKARPIIDWSDVGNSSGGGAAVGDILYSDMTTGKASNHTASGKTAIGVVFDPDKTLAIALDMEKLKWMEEDTGITIPEISPTIGCRGMDIGKRGTKLIHKVCAEKGKNCEAANYAYNFTTKGTSAGDWYMPSFDELDTMYTNKDTLNNSLTVAGGKEFEVDRYWTYELHSEDDSITSYYRDFTKASPGCLYGHNSSSFYVRPVINWSKIGEDDGPTTITTTACQNVGDILYYDQTCIPVDEFDLLKVPLENVIGVVTDPNKRTAIAFDTDLMSWANQLVDFSGLTNYSSAPKDDFNGKSNTATILSYCKSNGLTCDAAEFVNKYTTKGTSAGDWYLPAGGELETINNNLSVINKGLITAAQSKLPYGYGTTHWSSSEKDQSNVWSLSIKLYGGGWSSQGKTYTGNYVRPIINYSDLGSGSGGGSDGGSSGGTETSECKNIGDILYSDRFCITINQLMTGQIPSGKTAIGVVFNPDRRLAIGLKSERKVWSTVGLNIPGLTNITDASVVAADFEGQLNTYAIMDYCPNKGYSCPAAEYAYSYTTEGTDPGNWYIPAGGEALEIYNNATTLNRSLSHIGTRLHLSVKTISTTYETLWTSNKNEDIGAWSLFDGKLSESKTTQNFYVRPIIQYQ